MNKTEIKRNKITADILSFEKGNEHYEGIHSIKLISSKYNLMIMDDYMPILGELHGDMVLTFPDNEKVFIKGIIGYYRHSHNSFELVIKDKIHD